MADEFNWFVDAEDDVERTAKRLLKKSWYCEPCAVEVYQRACPHCGKTKRQRT